ncbi:unnamed protein product [Malus baccata var. baccata]
MKEVRDQELPCKTCGKKYHRKCVKQCDPEKENLCLYGFPNKEWKVNLPVEEVPPELSKPALGINFARDGIKVEDEEKFQNQSLPL